MTKYLLTFLIISFAFLQTAFAQNDLKGAITDESNTPIFFATVALYNQADSTIAKSASSGENGNYKLVDIKNGKYYLEVSMVGYATESKGNLVFPKDGSAKVNFKLFTDVKLLTAVEVTDKKPLLEQRSDRLIVNVAENITSMNSNLLDVMKKVPGIIVAGDRIKLAGSSNLTILINGKTTKYMDIESLMKDMPGDNIKRVEIIHQPGAEFDASGTGAIINIILKKNSLYGTSGSVNVGVGKGKLWRYKTGISLSHYQGNVNINGSLGYRNSGYFEGLTIDRRVKEDRYHQVSDQTDKSTNYRANLALDWDINDKHRIGFQSRYINHQSDYLTYNITDIIFASEPTNKIESNIPEDSFWKLRSINPYYTFEIDTLGQKLEVDVNYITFWNGSESILTATDLEANSVLGKQKYDRPGNTKIFVSKLDYTYPFSKNLKLQIGAKYSVADLDNDLQSSFDNAGEWINNPSESNHYLFEETIKAAYSKLSFNKDKWSGTLGLRYEDSDSQGQSVGIDTTLHRRIQQLFPSASLSRNLTKQLTGTIAYSYRLDRPRYSTLNPFRYSLDQFTSQRGNPALRPEFTNSMKFTLAYEKQPFFNIEYKLNTDAMVEVIEQDDATGEAFKTTVNLNSKKNFNVSLFFPLDFIPKITGYAGVIANHVQFDSPYLDQTFDQSKWDYTGFVQMNFTLPGKIESEVSGWYTTGGLEGIINSEWLYGVDIGFSKKFMDDKAKISIGVDNLLYRFFHGDVVYSNIDMNIISTWDAPVFNIQLRYKFGNQHMKSKKRRSGASEELRRTGKD